MINFSKNNSNNNCVISAMSELLFECYNVPSVAYGIDSLFSLYNNIPSSGEYTYCKLKHYPVHVVWK